MNLTSLLCCSKLPLYAILGYIVLFCAVHLSSPLPCGSVVLHQVIETERCRCWVSYQLCCVCVCLWGQMWCLCFVDTVQHSNLLFLLQRIYISLPVSSPVLPIPLSVTRGCACLSCSVLLAFTWSPSSNFSEKVNAAPLAAAESALMLFCQPSPASLRLLPASLPFPLSLAKLARHIKWPLTAASATRSNSDITPLYMRLQFLPK